MKKRKLVINRKESVGAYYTPTYLKDRIDYYLSYSNYCDLLYIIINKGYTYRREAAKIVGFEVRHYIDRLINEGFVEVFNLSDKQKNILKITKNLGEYHLALLQTFRFTSEARMIIQDPLVYQKILRGANPKINNYLDLMSEQYRDNVDKIEKKEELTRLKYINDMRVNNIGVSGEDQEWFEHYYGRKFKW